MKKMGKGLLLALTLAVGGFVVGQQPLSAHASTTFSSVPSGHFQSAKAQYAFHWQNVKVKKQTTKVLVFGNFKGASVRYGIPTKYKLSKNHRTLNTYYRLMSLKGNLGKTVYKMSTYKYSNTKYRVKLYTYKNGLLPSYKGKSYTFKLTKGSPAKSFANKYTKPNLTKSLTASLTKYVADQYAAGKSSLDPNDAKVKAAITQSANTTTTKNINALVKAYAMQN